MQLNKYDVILQKGHVGIVSSIIRKVTGNIYNHSAIYMGNLHIIEAVRTGVKVNNMSYALGEFDAYRYYRKITQSEQAKIEEFLEKAVNSKYDYLELIGQLFGIKAGNKKKFICISLLMEAFQYAGLEVGEWQVGFAQVSDSKYFVKVNE